MLPSKAHAERRWQTYRPIPRRGVSDGRERPRSSARRNAPLRVRRKVAAAARASRHVVARERHGRGDGDKAEADTHRSETDDVSGALHRGRRIVASFVSKCDMRQRRRANCSDGYMARVAIDNSPQQRRRLLIVPVAIVDYLLSLASNGANMQGERRQRREEAAIAIDVRRTRRVQARARGPPRAKRRRGRCPRNPTWVMAGTHSAHARAEHIDAFIYQSSHLPNVLCGAIDSIRSIAKRRTHQKHARA